MTVDTAPLLALARRIAAAAGAKPRTNRVTRATKHRVWTRAGGACEGCGSRDGLAVHHVIPRSKGGSNREGNLKLYCESCERHDHRKHGIET